MAGFIAPAWLYGDGAMEAMKVAGIPLAEDHFRVWSPTEGRRLATGPVVTWASRTRARLSSSIIAAPIVRSLPMKVLRVGVHPPDIRHAALVRSIRKTFRSASTNRRPASYAELVATRAG